MGPPTWHTPQYLNSVACNIGKGTPSADAQKVLHQSCAEEAWYSMVCLMVCNFKLFIKIPY